MIRQKLRQIILEDLLVNKIVFVNNHSQNDFHLLRKQCFLLYPSQETWSASNVCATIFSSSSKDFCLFTADSTDSLPVRGRLGNRNNNVSDIQADMSEKTREKIENIIRNQGGRAPPTQNGGRLPSHDSTPTGTLEHRRNGGRDSPQNKTSPAGSYTSGSTLSLNHHGNTNSSPLRTIDHAFVGMDNYGYEWRKSHLYGVTAPAYNEAIHGPSRVSYMSSVGSDDASVPIMDSKGMFPPKY